MSAAEAAPDPTPSRSGRLLNFVRRLIDFGRHIATTFRDDLRSFGTTDLALIVARITRGLLLAHALEARIVRDAARLDAEPAPRRLRKPRPARPAGASPADSTAPGLPLAPTPEQIEAWVRRRPIGAVIADICRDLGVMPSNDLWPELRDLITIYHGNLVRLVTDILDRRLGPVPSLQSLRWIPAPALPSPAPSGPDPP